MSKNMGMKVVGYGLAIFYAISFAMFAQWFRYAGFQAQATILAGLFGLMTVGAIGVARLQNWGRRLLMFTNAVAFFYLIYLYFMYGRFESLFYAVMSIVVLMYMNIGRIKTYFEAGSVIDWHCILVIDDDETLVRTIRPILISQGYSVLTASTGEEGLRMAREKQPDLIILDVILPGIKGRDVCKRLKDDKATRNIPVVFLTAKDSPDDVAAEIGAGAETHLTKPVDGQILLATIQKILK